MSESPKLETNFDLTVCSSGTPMIIGTLVFCTTLVISVAVSSETLLQEHASILLSHPPSSLLLYFPPSPSQTTHLCYLPLHPLELCFCQPTNHLCCLRSHFCVTKYEKGLDDLLVLNSFLIYDRSWDPGLRLKDVLYNVLVWSWALTLAGNKSLLL